MKRLTSCLLAAGLALVCGLVQAAPQRVVVLGGPITEIVYALGAGSRVVGADQSSVYPPATAALPKVGYYRAFSLEGVLSLKPDLILASDQAGPPETMARLRKLGKPVVILPSGADLPALKQRISEISNALQIPAAGQALNQQLDSELASLTPAAPGSARTLLLISRSNRPEGAGKDTAADSMLRLAGLTNVLASQQGYKPLAPEGIASLRPEQIVTSTLSVQALGGIDKLLAMPGIAQTPAAKNRRVIILDDLLLLGFGPRLPQALRQLRGLDAKP